MPSIRFLEREAKSRFQHFIFVMSRLKKGKHRMGGFEARSQVPLFFY